MKTIKWIKTQLVLGCAVILASLGSIAQASEIKMPFSVRLTDSNPTSFTVTNESGEEFVRLRINIGNYEDYGFDLGDDQRVTSRSTGISGYKFAQTGGRSSESVLTEINGWTKGKFITLVLDLDKDDSNSDTRPSGSMFNNGYQPNGSFTVWNKNGDTYTYTLTDENQLPNTSHTFYTTDRPPSFTVSSFKTGNDLYGATYVPSASVKVNGQVLSSTVGQKQSFNVDYGDVVEILAPQFVYQNNSGQFLTDSDRENNTSTVLQSMRRMSAVGISVGDVVQSGDPTLYKFAVDENNISLAVKWERAYALRIQSDFSRTKSELKDSIGEPWVGPAQSEALGNPSPAVQLHWINEGELVIGQVDGYVLDQTYPGQNVRYVPTGYDAFGSANGTTITTSGYHAFHVGQAPVSRQQTDQFVMNGPATVQYRWQLQYGVEQNVELDTYSAMPILETLTDAGAVIQTYSGAGTYWFDPQTRVRVGCRAVETSPEGKALAGWNVGDNFYFDSSGEISPTDGSIISGDTSNADWIPSYTSDGNAYRALEISKDRISSGFGGMMRPVSVMWSYGDPAFEITVPIGQYALQTPVTALGKNYDGTSFLNEPSVYRQLSVSGTSPVASGNAMAVWDEVARKLYPVVPGQLVVTWTPVDDPDRPISVYITAVLPDEPHYPHIAETPAVNVDPAADDDFIFKEVKYTETDAVVDGDNGFTSTEEGWSVLLFGEIVSTGRGQAAEFTRVRTVRTRKWNEVLQSPKNAVIGKAISDDLDLAKLGTGYLQNLNARYNANVYDVTKLSNLAPDDVYDMQALSSTERLKEIVNPTALPGPVIPVNLHPGATADQQIVITWYDDPSLNDNMLWPYAVRSYVPYWPTTAAEGLRRIVIASQLGSESVSALGVDQEMAAAVVQTGVNEDGSGWTNEIAAATTYDPSRLQNPIIYSQPDRTLAGYNPNEEHALMAPSYRFATISPRPQAAYALRDNDLNVYTRSSATAAGQSAATYTSHPYVLVQYYDTADETYKMNVFYVQREDSNITGYRFANTTQIHSESGVRYEPSVTMEAGEPVIPFYPLGVAQGAVAPAETHGVDLFAQKTYWEDHKGTSWAVSGGDKAWFTQHPFYPLLPDFWWPEDTSGRVVADSAENLIATEPAVGDNLAFLPSTISYLQALPAGSTVNKLDYGIKCDAQLILYHSVWPVTLPILKAGETLTYSGGEYRTDYPTTSEVDENNELVTVETPGLPGVLAFAVAEVAYDSLNPAGLSANLTGAWTARIAQVLETRTVDFSFENFPADLAPASGNTRISSGKYIFTGLPASLQNRFRYDPVGQNMEFFGLVNEKGIADDTLTASPPAVYALEPNIMSPADLVVLKNLDSSQSWKDAIEELYQLCRNPDQIESNNQVIEDQYLVGLQRKVIRNSITEKPVLVPIEAGSSVTIAKRDDNVKESLRAFGPGLALLPNAAYLDPKSDVPDFSYITVAENNDSSMGGSPVTLHVIKVDRDYRYRGSVKTILSDNVFDENVVMRHTGDFGANAGDLYVEWWYRPDDGSLNVPPPDQFAGKTNPWKLFPDTSGGRGKGQYEITLKGNPNAPEALLADTWWFARYRHKNDVVNSTNWAVTQSDGTASVNFMWAGAGNSDPFNDYDLDGYADYVAQLSMGWIKRVLDAVNPYEARITDFEGDAPATASSMIRQFGARYEGPVALNPDKNVIENVGLIELYETILKRGRDLSIDLSTPVSTPAIANALQLASTRISDFYTLLGNEAYADAENPTIGFGSDSVDYGNAAPSVFTFQNQLSTLADEELGLLRGLDDNFARPVYNRLFWNFTKGEGEAAYAMNYTIRDENEDGFIDEDDAMILYPQGHGDAWGHYLTALRNQYDLLNNKNFNWVSRSEFYNLMDVVMKVDFLDERKFAETAAAKAKAGAEIVDLTYREDYVLDPEAQWQGYTDSNEDRAWGVQGWARRAWQGAYFDWVTANALLPSEHPNESLEGIQKVDRESNADIPMISANMNRIQNTFDNANKGYNPLGLSKDAMAFDLDPNGGRPFEQVYERATTATSNAKVAWDNANQYDNMLRQVANDEESFAQETYEQDLAYKNDLIAIFGRPYAGTIGSGKLYAAGYDGPDLALHMYVGVREVDANTLPAPSSSFGSYTDGVFSESALVSSMTSDNDDDNELLDVSDSWIKNYAPNLYNTANLEGTLTVEFEDAESLLVNQSGKSLMPVTTAGYTYQAPDAWGDRLAKGELQCILSEMVQQELAMNQAISAWSSLGGEIKDAIESMSSEMKFEANISSKQDAFATAQFALDQSIFIIDSVLNGVSTFADLTTESLEATAESIPQGLPIAGFSFSPGDALSAARGGVKFVKVATRSTADVITWGYEQAKVALEFAMTIAEHELEAWEANEREEQAHKAQLEEIDGMFASEPDLRLAVFKEMEALRELSDRYRTVLDEGTRLVDERTAFNKKVAAQTQMNRYQDMTFRVSRNHALATYRNSFNIASRYAYLAARAYDYETNFDANDSGSAQPVIEDIIKARHIGLFDGEPQQGEGGLADALATLKANYTALSSQLGITNPQLEMGKMSLRTQRYRILPKGSVQPEGIDDLPSPGGDSDALWRETLRRAKVADLWDVPEFRQYCRPFDAETDTSGQHVAQPGLVLRFSTDIDSGKNVFGHPLAGNDNFYDSSVYATKISAAGVWFSDYLSDDLLHDLPETPRVYLVPVGTDIMSVPNSPNPDVTREWSVVDQRIPTPVPAVGSDLDNTSWSPLYDSLNGDFGEIRRFSSFRAYHDGSDAVDTDELVTDSRLFGRSVWNTQWVLIIPGASLNADSDEGLNRFMEQVSDIKLVFETYGISGN